MLGVAHVDVVPWVELAPVLDARPHDVVRRPCDEVHGLPFDHDQIVRLAAEHARTRYRERPDPAGLVAEPFTLHELPVVHQAVLGRLPRLADIFQRSVLPPLTEVPGVREETVEERAQVYRIAAGRSTGSNFSKVGASRVFYCVVMAPIAAIAGILVL